MTKYQILLQSKCFQVLLLFLSFEEGLNSIIIKTMYRKARFQQYLNDELPDVQAEFRKGKGTAIKLSTATVSSKKEESSRKTSISALLIVPKPLTLWITANCGKFFKWQEYQSNLPASWEIHIQVKKQQLEPDMEQQNGSKSEKEYAKAVYCHPAYLTYMESTSRNMPGWMKHKVVSRLPEEISVISDTQMTPPLWQKVKMN